MKIAFVGSADPFLGVYPPGGGIETQIWGIAKKLSARGHDVHVLARYRGFDARQVSGISIHGIRAAVPDRIVSYFVFSRNAARELKEIQPDAVYLAERFTGLFPSMLGVPKIFVTHNKEAFDFYLRFAKDNPLRMGLSLFKRRIEDRVIRNSSIVCAPNEALAEMLVRRGYDNVGVLPNGVDASEYACGPDGGYILYSGWLNEIKGVQYLIKAFAEVSPQFPNAKLIVSGDGPYRGHLESLARTSPSRDSIEFRRWSSRAEYLRLVSNCTLLVLPSLTETFGVVLLDAMASCKPVVASDIVGPNDVIEDGECGLLFPPGDTSALASRISRLLGDEGMRNTMGHRGRQMVEKAFDIGQIASTLEAMFIASGARERAN